MRSQGFWSFKGIFKKQAGDGEGHFRKFAWCCDNALSGIWRGQRDRKQECEKLGSEN